MQNCEERSRHAAAVPESEVLKSLTLEDLRIDRREEVLDLGARGRLGNFDTGQALEGRDVSLGAERDQCRGGLAGSELEVDR